MVRRTTYPVLLADIHCTLSRNPEKRRALPQLEGIRVNPDVMFHHLTAAADRTMVDVRECRQEGHAPVVSLLLVPPPYFLSGRVVWAERAAEEIDRLTAAFRDQSNARDDVFSAILTEMIQPHAPPLPMLESALLWWVSQMDSDYERTHP